MAAFRNRLERWAQVAGLLATGWVVWATSVAPQWRRGRLWQQIAAAAFIAVWALGWSFAMALALRLVSRRPKRAETETATLPASAVAVWYAPATILLLQCSPTGVTAGLALVVAATRLLCASSWIRDAEADRPGAHFALAMTVSAGLQSAATSVLMGQRLPAAGLVAMSVAVLTSLAIGRGVW